MGERKMVPKAEKIIYNKLTPALKEHNKEIAEKHWEEIVLALGEVAAGVAHEIRNPLTGIKGFSQLLQGRFSPGDKEWPYISNIIKEAEKIENLIEELLMLSRPTFPRKRWTKLSRIIDDTLPMLAKEAVNRRVKIVTEYDDLLREIRVDGNQLRIALFHLGKNSIHAMGTGQILKITTRLNQEEECGEISFSRPVAKINESSTSLGSAVVQRIIENHHGTLQTSVLGNVDSQITIKIPIS